MLYSSFSKTPETYACIQSSNPVIDIVSNACDVNPQQHSRHLGIPLVCPALLLVIRGYLQSQIRAFEHFCLSKRSRTTLHQAIVGTLPVPVHESGAFNKGALVMMRGSTRWSEASSASSRTPTRSKIQPSNSLSLR